MPRRYYLEDRSLDDAHAQFAAALARAGCGGALPAEPVFGKSNLIYTMAHADGLLHVPLDLAGLYAGDTVRVRVF